ncbi:MAG: hypothetical protein R3D45_07600 [Rhizobiaceae bacterium]
MNDETKTSPDHFCPGCGVRLRFGARTPWYFCGACTKTATDARGWPIRFIGMGAEWCYADGYGPDAHDNKAIGVACLINGRPVIVHEARQGGVVAEPVFREHVKQIQYLGQSAQEHAWLARGLVDLTNERTLDRVIAERLVKPGRAVRY